MSCITPSASGDPTAPAILQQRRVRFSAACLDNMKDIEEVEALVQPTDEEMSDVLDNYATAPADNCAPSNGTTYLPCTPPRLPQGDSTSTAHDSMPTQGTSARATIDTFSKNQNTQTPAKLVSTDTLRDLGTVKDMRKHLAAELGHRIPEVKLSWLLTCYEGLVRTTRIQQYLNTTEQYRDGRWVGLPRVAKQEDLLYDPFCNIINSILEYFRYAGKKGYISIRASGPSFVCPTGGEIGFSNLASCFDGKRDSDVDPEDKHIPQLGIYARQVFICQPNRRYARFMIVTEQRARVVHFDRSGAQYTELFDIHAEPIWFIQLVLGLCTNDERLLGLDDTVQWTVGLDGVRTGGTLSTVDMDKNPITYTLSMNETTWYRSSLCGRGMVCWPVKDRDGNRLIVKDYWMSEGRVPEYELLEKVKGVPGICELVAYEGRRGETRDFRGDTSLTTKPGDLFNCIAIRMIIKAYGTSIDNFTSPEEMLAALRDAIAAHYDLVKKGFFHRDICHNTVLLATEGAKAEPGHRGVLMDLDMAIGAIRPESDKFQERFKLGIVLFQPAILLKALNLSDDVKATLPAHDCLDDLEAFFWLLCYLILIHTPTGSTGPKTVFHIRLGKWMAQSGNLDESKFHFLISQSIAKEAQQAMYPVWKELCMDLFLGFRDIVADIYSRKEALLYDEPEPLEDGIVPNRFAEVLEDVDDIYEQVLALFDDALDKALSRAANAQNQEQGSDSAIDSDSTTGATAEPRLIIRPRTRSMRRLMPIPEEAPVESNKRRPTESDEDEETHTPSKRMRPPRQGDGPSAFFQPNGNGDSC
ncbi:hypothetical protein MD484_g8429, partial [Candolleomyces efflorescens]